MKRVLAWLGIILILAIYIVGLVFAAMGGSMAVPVAMSSILIVMYLSFYFHLGRIFVGILKRDRDKKEEQRSSEKNIKE